MHFKNQWDKAGTEELSGQEGLELDESESKGKTAR